MIHIEQYLTYMIRKHYEASFNPIFFIEHTHSRGKYQEVSLIFLECLSSVLISEELLIILELMAIESPETNSKIEQIKRLGQSMLPLVDKMRKNGSKKCFQYDFNEQILKLDALAFVLKTIYQTKN